MSRSRCPTCPVAPEAPCQAITLGSRRLCELAARPGAYRDLMSRPPSTGGAAPVLAGDRIAAWARRTGLDRLATAWERRTGRPCGCDKRRRLANRLHAAIRTLLSRKA